MQALNVPLRPIGLLLSLALLVSCRGTGVIAASGEEIPPPRTDVVVGDSGLARDVTITNSRVRRAGDLLEVQFDVVNRRRREMSFEYKFDWADAEGFKIPENVEPWTPITLGARESKPVRAVAPDPTATRWTLKVRYPQETP